MKEKFLEDSEQFYGAKPVTLSGIEEDDLAAINKWVKEATNGQIPTFLQQLPANTVMLLLNAIHFHGELHSLVQEEGLEIWSFAVSAVAEWLLLSWLPQSQAARSPLVQLLFLLLDFFTVMIPSCCMCAKNVTRQQQSQNAAGGTCGIFASWFSIPGSGTSQLLCTRSHTKHRAARQLLWVSF